MALTVRHLSKSYGGVQAVRDVSFAVDSGELVAIIGPNGAGKTSMVNVISGFYRPTRGRILFQDRDRTDLKSWEVAELGIAGWCVIPVTSRMSKATVIGQDSPGTSSPWQPNEVIVNERGPEVVSTPWSTIVAGVAPVEVTWNVCVGFEPEPISTLPKA